MGLLDLRTILVSYSLCNLICVIVLFSLWRQNHKRFNGLDYFMSSFILNFLGILLLGFRDVAPDLLTLLLGNVLIIAGVLILFIGISAFLERKFYKTFNFIIFGFYIILQTWLIYGYPHLQYRMILFSAVISIYCFQMTWILFSIKDKANRSILRGLGGISIVYWVTGIARIVYQVISPGRNDFFEANAFEKAIYLVFQVIYIVLTFYIFLMVNRRLVINLEDDIKIRKLTESALEISQEKLLKVFQASPNPVLISRMSDGKIIDANQSFISLIGYSREEVLTNSTLSLNFWVDLKKRKQVVTMMEETHQVQGFEFEGRLKSGEILIFLFSGAMININDENCLISYLQDVTEWKKNQDIISLRLQLWEYASSHTTLELMQKTLDGIEDLTGSKISFIHLVNMASGTLILQTWSTRTRDHFCKAEGEGMHYGLDKAGVWADSVRKKKPIIHNDYASLPERKGMPSGHAEVIRELVVPIIRKGCVEAVLGVGNKPFDYDDKDIELVKHVANTIWPTILEKQAEEEVEQLNLKLEKLAMEDELTKLANRRSFFIRGNEEILRAKRYLTPLSLIMLDIDKFKLINDSFGHEYGDMALQSLADILRSKVREVDVVGRLGGEEFGVLLPNTDVDHALILAERLRLAVEKESSLKNEIQFSFTASFGVAELNNEMSTLDDFLRNADTAMYQAKNQGRNRVVMFTPDLKI